MEIKDLINEAASLPLEERAMVVDVLLRSLNPSESVIDKEWTALAQSRLEALRSGSVTAISGEQVFTKVWKRFAECAFVFIRMLRQSFFKLFNMMKI